MNLLHIDASVLGDHSVSRQVSAAVVERLLSADPTLRPSRSRTSRACIWQLRKAL
jgi:FMN-dependent NADH-azoreductase